MNVRQLGLVLLCGVVGLASCSLPHQYDNEYTPPNHMVQGAFVGGVAGASATAIGGGSIPAGVLAGSVIGGVLGYSQDKATGPLSRLSSAGVRVVRHGETLTVVLPSDLIFYRNSARINPDCYPYLVEVAGVVSRQATPPITISAYSDNTGGSRHQLERTQAQAQSVLAYFWSHGIDFHTMRAVGYGSAPDVADNHTVEGSAMNRRVEITFKSGHW